MWFAYRSDRFANMSDEEEIFYEEDHASYLIDDMNDLQYNYNDGLEPELAASSVVWSESDLQLHQILEEWNMAHLKVKLDGM